MEFQLTTETFTQWNAKHQTCFNLRTLNIRDIDWLDFLGGTEGKESTCNAGGRGLILGKRPWRRQWLPTPVFLPGVSHGQRNWQATDHGVENSWTQLKRLTVSDWLGKASQKSSAVFSLRIITFFWLVLNRGWYLSHQGTIRSYNQVKISRENMSGHCPYPYHVRGYHLLNAYHELSAYM